MSVNIDLNLGLPVVGVTQNGVDVVDGGGVARVVVPDVSDFATAEALAAEAATRASEDAEIVALIPDVSNFVTLSNINTSIAAHDSDTTAHDDIRAAIPDISDFVAQGDIDTSISTHDNDATAHEDLRLALSAEGSARAAADNDLQAAIDDETAERENEITRVVGLIPNVSNFVTQSAVDAAVIAHDADAQNNQHPALRSLIAGKQDALTAGANILIIDNVISATGGGGGVAGVQSVTAANGETLISVNNTNIASPVISSTNALRDAVTLAETALQSFAESDPIYTADKPTLALKSEIPDISGLATTADLNAETSARTIAVGAVQTAISNEANTRASEITRVEGLIPDTSGFVGQSAINSSINAHNNSSAAHADIRDAIPDVSGLATAAALASEATTRASEVSRVEGLIPNVSNFVTQSNVNASVSTHNGDSAAHNDIRITISDVAGRVTVIEGDYLTSADVADFATAASIATAVSTHNSSNAAHNDIRSAIAAETSERTSALSGVYEAIGSEASTREGEITRVEGLIPNVSSFVTQSNINTSIAAHDADTSAHEDIRTAITSAVSTHNSNASAHSDIRTSVAAVSGRVDTIEGKIPAQASASNQLADKNFVNSSIEQVAGNRVTYTIVGEPFPTRQTLTNATTFYSRGAEYVPTAHDYCLISADEDAPAPFTNGQTRMEYDGSNWIYAYGINNRPFTAAETAAIESGITAALRTSYSSHLADSAIHITGTERTTWNAKQNALTTQTALSNAAVKITTNTLGQVTGSSALTKADVGLGNVDNTSDLAKPISTATQTAITAISPLEATTSTAASVSAANPTRLVWVPEA